MEALREPGGQEKCFIALVDGFESYSSKKTKSLDNILDFII